MNIRPAFVVVVVVLVALAALWPALRRSDAQAREEAARHDVDAIERALIRFYEDNGFFPLWDKTPPGSADSLRRVDLLAGPGAIPAASSASRWITGIRGTLIDELIDNAPSYKVKESPDDTGWAGPYLPAALRPDPWNHQYVVNVGLLSSGDETADDAAKYAVWVLSAGPNGVIDTPYRQPIESAALGGDDIGARVQ
jgi:type II secretory pathway pseudopilin PulG